MRRAAMLLVLALGMPVTPATAQEWRAGFEVGRLSFDGAPLATAQQSSFALGVHRTAFTEWLGLSLAVPLDDGVLWASGGAAKRFIMDARYGFGFDVAAYGFVQRTRVEPEPLPSGDGLGLIPQPTAPARPAEADYVAGGAGQAMAVAFARVGTSRIELRGGLATHAASEDGSGGGYVPAADGRILLQLGPVQPGVEIRHWHDRATYAGATTRLGYGAFDAWAGAGRWTSGGPTELAWSAGAGVSLPAGLRVEASYRHGGYDPLFRSSTGTVASIGASVRLGNARSYASPVPHAYAAGRALIRLRGRDARDVRGTPRVAGDFTSWQPVAMTEAGGDWMIWLPLEAGVYHYAFVDEEGGWFVPESTPGRQSDGMGGHVAVLVVSP